MPASSETSTETTPNTVSWQIEPERFLSRHWELYQDDELVTTLRMGFWQEGCQFQLVGRTFIISRKSIWKDGFVLACDDQVLCDVKRNFWSRRFEITASEQQWVFQPAGWWSREYHLQSGERVEGVVRPAGWFTRKRVAEFSPQVPPPVQVLAIYLQLVVSIRRQQNSAAGST